MPFLPPNQQRQSTEGNWNNYIENYQKSIVALRTMPIKKNVLTEFSLYYKLLHFLH